MVELYTPVCIEIYYGTSCLELPDFSYRLVKIKCIPSHSEFCSKSAPTSRILPSTIIGLDLASGL